MMSLNRFRKARNNVGPLHARSYKWRLPLLLGLMITPVLSMNPLGQEVTEAEQKDPASSKVHPFVQAIRDSGRVIYPGLSSILYRVIQQRKIVFVEADCPKTKERKQFILKRSESLSHEYSDYQCDQKEFEAMQRITAMLADGKTEGHNILWGATVRDSKADICRKLISSDTSDAGFSRTALENWKRRNTRFAIYPYVGENAREWLTKNDVSKEDFFEIIRQVLRGHTTLHNIGITHRDPELRQFSILPTADGLKCTVYDYDSSLLRNGKNEDEWKLSFVQEYEMFFTGVITNMASVLRETSDTHWKISPEKMAALRRNRMHILRQDMRSDCSGPSMSRFYDAVCKWLNELESSIELVKKKDGKVDPLAHYNCPLRKLCEEMENSLHCAWFLHRVQDQMETIRKLKGDENTQKAIHMLDGKIRAFTSEVWRILEEDEGALLRRSPPPIDSPCQTPSGESSESELADRTISGKDFDLTGQHNIVAAICLHIGKPDHRPGSPGYLNGSHKPLRLPDALGAISKYFNDVLEYLESADFPTWVLYTGKQVAIKNDSGVTVKHARIVGQQEDGKFLLQYAVDPDSIRINIDNDSTLFVLDTTIRGTFGLHKTEL